MTTEVDLLPLPDGGQMFHEGQMRAYARANVACAVAPLQAEIEALRAEVERLRKDAERWRALREMDGGEIYALLGDCDGIHPEQADAAIDQAIKESPVIAFLKDDAQ